MKIYDEKNMEALVIPIANLVLLTGMTYNLRINKLSKEEEEYLSNPENLTASLLLKQNVSKSEVNEESFYKIGSLFKVLEMEKLDKGYQVRIEVVDRVEIKGIRLEKDSISGRFEIASDINDLDEKSKESMLSYIKKVAREIGESFRGAEEFIKTIGEMNELNKLIGFLIQYMQLSAQEKYDLVQIQRMKERCYKFIDYLLKHRESVKLQFEMAERFSEKANKNYRQTVLKEQLKAIQEELNMGKDSLDNSNDDYREKIKLAKMPKEVEETALDELAKLELQNPSSPDYNVIRNYLDLLVRLPWASEEEKEVDINKARDILNEDHYGLEKVKERILQHMAVMKLRKDKKGSILLLVGPPGTGKTSLGKSIASALNRKYIRLSLGGIRDEAEIRGHRRTYVGAMPGRIIQSIRKAGVKNPVMILDEVDKLMAGYNGDPSSALLEVLDPEQNSTFTDHYLDVPYDLSEVFFIATANNIQAIPVPLLDRMEVIHISSYTSNEKFYIGKRHLIPQVVEEHGLTSEQLVIEDSTLLKIISEYTMEAGVRGLKNQLATIARVAAEKIVSNKAETPYIIKDEDLMGILGKEVSKHDKAQENNPAGVVTGLAWTPVGGEILFIEAIDMPGSGQVFLTGKLGDVMQESAKISLSLIKSRFVANNFNFKEKDLHLHVPSGSVPKDGPSAGVALFTALASLITGIKVDSKLAMTGEITLRGIVLPIGGLKEKLLGAERAGIRKVLIPKDNMDDLKDIPEEVRNKLTIITVETVEDVLKEALGISLPTIRQVFNFEAPFQEHFSIAPF